jgi:hypothetical protein
MDNLFWASVDDSKVVPNCHLLLLLNLAKAMGALLIYSHIKLTGWSSSVSPITANVQMFALLAAVISEDERKKAITVNSFNRTSADDTFSQNPRCRWENN